VEKRHHAEGSWNADTCSIGNFGFGLPTTRTLGAFARLQRSAIDRTSACAYASDKHSDWRQQDTRFTSRVCKKACNHRIDCATDVVERR
jgi:hypothetical protein